ncbi:MAG: hypothetical protein SGI89_12845 [bacterium]|nr:hypothetical protein [bacterium]
MLEKEFKYYIKNQEELVKKYKGKFLVIIGEKVVGDFIDKVTAYNESVKKYELGTFLIQQCLPGKDNYTQTFTSRVIYSC